MSASSPRRALLAALALVGGIGISVAACGGSSSGSATPGAAPAGTCDKGGAQVGDVDGLSVDVGGASRSYVLSVPSDYASHGALPLVLALHGSGGDGAGLRKHLGLAAITGGAAIDVFPDAQGGSWDIDTPNAGNRDLAFFDALVAAVSNSYCVDTSRVFVMGFSNGAYFANHLAFRRGQAVKGIAAMEGGGPYAGDYGADGELVVDGKVAAMIVHGQSDGTVSLDEGKKSLTYWQRANGCNAQQSEPTEPSPCVRFAGCANPVVFCEVPGLGHGIWPEGPKAAWSFFSAL